MSCARVFPRLSKLLLRPRGRGICRVLGFFPASASFCSSHAGRKFVPYFGFSPPQQASAQAARAGNLSCVWVFPRHNRLLHRLRGQEICAVFRLFPASASFYTGRAGRKFVPCFGFSPPQQALTPTAGLDEPFIFTILHVKSPYRHLRHTRYIAFPFCMPALAPP